MNNQVLFPIILTLRNHCVAGWPTPGCVPLPAGLPLRHLWGGGAAGVVPRGGGGRRVVVTQGTNHES